MLGSRSVTDVARNMESSRRPNTDCRRSPRLAKTEWRGWARNNPMPLIDKATLLAKLSPPLDDFLVGQLLDEFISIEKRYILRDWEPAELDGGQFSEILGRVLYHSDSGNLDRSRDFGDC